MVNVNTLKTKIETRVFVDLGSTATYIDVAKGTPDKWGDATDTDTSRSVVIVPWNHIFGRQSYEAFGDLAEGEVDVATYASESIAIDDELVFDGKTYKVKVVEHYILKDVNLVKIIRLVQEL